MVVRPCGMKSSTSITYGWAFHAKCNVLTKTQMLHVDGCVLANLPSSPVHFQVVQGEIGSVNNDHGKAGFFDGPLKGLHHASLVCACAQAHF